MAGELASPASQGMFLSLDSLTPGEMRRRWQVAAEAWAFLSQGKISFAAVLLLGPKVPHPDVCCEEKGVSLPPRRGPPNFRLWLGGLSAEEVAVRTKAHSRTDPRILRLREADDPLLNSGILQVQ